MQMRTVVVVLFASQCSVLSRTGIIHKKREAAGQNLMRIHIQISPVVVTSGSKTVEGRSFLVVYLQKAFVE